MSLSGGKKRKPFLRPTNPLVQSSVTRGFCCIFLSMSMPLRDLLTEEEKEAIWEHISNRFGFMELSNLSNREKEKLIANTWNNIKP